MRDIRTAALLIAIIAAFIIVIHYLNSRCYNCMHTVPDTSSTDSSKQIYGMNCGLAAPDTSITKQLNKSSR